MNTGIIARGTAVLLAWAAISGLASGQAQGPASDRWKVAAVSVRGGAGSSDIGEAVERMGEWLGTFDSIRSGLAKNDGFIRSDDKLVLAFLFEPMEGESKLLQQYLPGNVAGMTEVPDSFFTLLDEKLGDLWAEINRLAPTIAPVTGAEATGSLKSAVERRVAQGAPEARVVRTILSGSKWTVKMTEAGLPKSEYRKGFVMYRLPNQELVVCQQVVIERPYFGTAKSAIDYNVRLGYLRLQQLP